MDGSVSLRAIGVDGHAACSLWGLEWNAVLGNVDRRLSASGLKRTTQGYRRYRCGTCGKQFNERSTGPLDRVQYPSDVIALSWCSGCCVTN